MRTDHVEKFFSTRNSRWNIPTVETDQTFWIKRPKVNVFCNLLRRSLMKIESRLLTLMRLNKNQQINQNRNIKIHLIITGLRLY